MANLKYLQRRDAAVFPESTETLAVQEGNSQCLIHFCAVMLHDSNSCMPLDHVLNSCTKNNSASCFMPFDELTFCSPVAKSVCFVPALLAHPQGNCLGSKNTRLLKQQKPASKSLRGLDFLSALCAELQQ